MRNLTFSLTNTIEHNTPNMRGLLTRTTTHNPHYPPLSVTTGGLVTTIDNYKHHDVYQKRRTCTLSLRKHAQTRTNTRKHAQTRTNMHKHAQTCTRHSNSSALPTYSQLFSLSLGLPSSQSSQSCASRARKSEANGPFLQSTTCPQVRLRD